jgi:nitroreductase
MNEIKLGKPDHPVHEFITKRWSPYAASSYNEQPWSYMVATKDNADEFARLLTCLVEQNQAWAKAAPVLAIGCTSLNFKKNGKPNAAAVHDLGLAAGNICFEATARGLYVHQMIGILPDKVRELYNVPDGVQPLTGLAIGYAADPSTLSEKLKERDIAPRTRKPLAEFVFSGKWGTASRLA